MPCVRRRWKIRCKGKRCDAPLAALQAYNSFPTMSVLRAGLMLLLAMPQATRPKGLMRRTDGTFRITGLRPAAYG